MVSCICLDLYDWDESRTWNKEHVFSTSGHFVLFRSETDMAAFLQQHNLDLDDDRMLPVRIFDSLSTGELFQDYGFMTDCGKYAVMLDDISLFKIISGHTDNITQFLHQFEEHCVACVPSNPDFYICARHDEELAARTADAYQVVIAFISCN